MEDLDHFSNTTAGLSSSLFLTTTTTLNLLPTPSFTDDTVDAEPTFPLLLLEQPYNDKNTSPPSSISSGSCSASSADDEVDVMPSSLSSGNLYSAYSMPNRQSSAGPAVSSETASANTSPWMHSASMTPYSNHALSAQYVPSSNIGPFHQTQQQQLQQQQQHQQYHLAQDQTRFGQMVGGRRTHQTSLNPGQMHAYAGQKQPNDAESASTYAYAASHNQSFQGVPAFSPTFAVPQTSLHESSGAASCLCRAFGQETCTCGASTAMKFSSRSVATISSGEHVPNASHAPTLPHRGVANATFASGTSGTSSNVHSFTLPAVARPSGVAATYNPSQIAVPASSGAHVASSSSDHLSNSLYAQPTPAFGGSQSDAGLANVSPNYSLASSAALRVHANPTGAVWTAPPHVGEFQSSSVFQHHAPFTPASTSTSSGGSLMGTDMYERGSSYPVTPRGSSSHGGMAFGSFVSQPTSTLSVGGGGGGIDEGNGRINASSKYATEEGRWDAVLRRSHSADSHFVYAALTTRIYCRPSCASKRPDRGRVQFFAFPDAAAKAEASGFRACKRCKPGTPGTADVCVLAVGECLRHMTRAALLGESDEVDMRLKRRTLKQYSNDYGVSAFHFHRTLKNVCTLTPGEYSKAAHSLVLQDELGIDRYGSPLAPEELSARLRGWSTRRARRALGNILPHAYASGLPDVQVRFVVADDTPFGRVVVLLALGQSALHSPLDHHRRPPSSTEASIESAAVVAPLSSSSSSDVNQSIAVLGILIGEDAVQRATTRCPRAIRDERRTAWLVDLINSLVAKGTREVQMPREVIPWIRRARVYLAAKNALEQSSARTHAVSSSSIGVGRASSGSYHGHKLEGDQPYELDFVDDGFDDEDF